MFFILGLLNFIIGVSAQELIRISQEDLDREMNNWLDHVIVLDHAECNLIANTLFFSTQFALLDAQIRRLCAHLSRINKKIDEYTDSQEQLLEMQTTITILQQQLNEHKKMKALWRACLEELKQHPEARTAVDHILLIEQTIIIKFLRSRKTNYQTMLANLDTSLINTLSVMEKAHLECKVLHDSLAVLEDGQPEKLSLHHMYQAIKLTQQVNGKENNERLIICDSLKEFQYIMLDVSAQLCYLSYKKLFLACTSNTLATPFTYMFDEQGIVPHDKQITFLPAPL